MEVYNSNVTFTLLSQALVIVAEVCDDILKSHVMF